MEMTEKEYEYALKRLELYNKCNVGLLPAKTFLKKMVELEQEYKEQANVK